jgi:hypothetical protein
VSRLRDVLPDTVRGFISLSFASATALLVLFGVTRFIPFGLLAVVAFFAGLYLVVHTVWNTFERWLGWTQREQ